LCAANRSAVDSGRDSAARRRSSLEHPTGFEFAMPGIYHTFGARTSHQGAGPEHVVPLTDRNPQKFVRISDAVRIRFKRHPARLPHGANARPR